MINYKLATQLKDAGFPQGIKWGDFMYDKIGKGKDSIILYAVQRLKETEPIGKAIKIPTLSELIEACGKRVGFELLEEFGEKDRNFKAVVNYPKLNMARGKSPEEAVGKLLVKLL